MGLLTDSQNCVLRMRRERRERFPRHRGLAIPTCTTARAWRTCCDACRDRELAVSLEVGGGENVPGIPSVCATRNFAYLVRGPCTLAAWNSCWHHDRLLSEFIITACFLFMFIIYSYETYVSIYLQTLIGVPIILINPYTTRSLGFFHDILPVFYVVVYIYKCVCVCDCVCDMFVSDTDSLVL